MDIKLKLHQPVRLPLMYEMKSHIIIIMFLIFSFSSLAQEKFKAKAKEITYYVFDWPSLNMICYRNVKNKLFRQRIARAEKYSDPLFNQIPVFDRKNDPRKDIYRIIAESLSKISPLLIKD